MNKELEQAIDKVFNELMAMPQEEFFWLWYSHDNTDCLGIGLMPR
jgi:hypothetical protein